MRSLAIRLTLLEAAYEQRLANWWRGLSLERQEAEVNARFGPDTWRWLEEIAPTLSDAEIQNGTLWQAYVRWRREHA